MQFTHRFYYEVQLSRFHKIQRLNSLDGPVHKFKKYWVPGMVDKYACVADHVVITVEEAESEGIIRW